MPKTENLNPPDEPRTKVCPECNGTGAFAGSWRGDNDFDPCIVCEGTGEIIMPLDRDEYFDETLADDYRIPE